VTAWQINPDTQNFHVCTIAVHPELNLETVHAQREVVFIHPAFQLSRHSLVARRAPNPKPHKTVTMNLS
jgi:hypothetical protein